MKCFVLGHSSGLQAGVDMLLQWLTSYINNQFDSMESYLTWYLSYNIAAK